MPSVSKDGGSLEAPGLVRDSALGASKARVNALMLRTPHHEGKATRQTALPYVRSRMWKPRWRSSRKINPRSSTNTSLDSG